MFFKNKHPQKGMTLIEVAMVLAIAAVVIGGVMTLYLSTSTQRKTTDTVTKIVSILQGVNSLYQGNATGFEGLVTTTGAQASIVDCDTGGTTCLTPFGGTSYFNFGYMQKDTNTGMSQGLLAVGNIPVEACIGIAKGAYGSAVKEIDAVGSGSITASKISSITTLPGTPQKIFDSGTAVSPADIVAKCSAAGTATNGYVDVVLTLQPS